MQSLLEMPASLPQHCHWKGKSTLAQTRAYLDAIAVHRMPEVRKNLQTRSHHKNKSTHGLIMEPQLQGIMKNSVRNLLLLTGTATAITGFILQLGFHIGRPERFQGHRLQSIIPHETIWGLAQSDWSTIHKVTILLFLALTTYHVIKHATWYRNVLSRKPVRDKRQTRALSVLFVLVALTGLTPWWLDFFGYSKDMRLILIELHDKLSILLTICLLLHVRKRFTRAKRA